ncbi:MAG: phage major capsid protein, partial [Mycobacterium sp.]|nr:phage major capsid protein [Mycobacterium sp.]
MTSPDYAAKALTTGGIDIPTVVDPTQEPLPAARATRILELLPRAPLTVNSYGYLQQTARTPNAAPVADNDPKPTSVYTWEDFEDRARVIAHLSEPIPRRYFSDVAELQRVLQDEMAEDLLIQLETQCVSGSGTGENFTGVLTASSVPFQPFVTDIWTTCRRARTTLELANVTPNAWVFHP